MQKKALISLKKLELEIASELDERVREVNIDAEKNTQMGRDSQAAD